MPHKLVIIQAMVDTIITFSSLQQIVQMILKEADELLMSFVFRDGLTVDRRFVQNILDLRYGLANGGYTLKMVAFNA